MLAGGPFVGKIFDDYGPRYLLAGGTFFHVFGLMMTSISKKYYQILLAQAICSAIGASMVFYPAFTCVSINQHSVRMVLIDVIGIDMVLCEARRRAGPRCSRIISGGRYSSCHGH